MGKLACQLTIGAAAICALIQSVALWRPYMSIGIVSVAGFFLKVPIVNCHMYWNTIQIRLTRFDYIAAAKKVPFSSRQIAAKRAEYAAKKIDECAESTIQEEANEAFGSGASENKTKYINQRKNQCRVSKIFESNSRLQKLKRACDSSLSEECYDVPLNEYASYMSNNLMNNLLPVVGGMFPGAGPQQAMALYTGGWTLCISTVFSIIALALGCGHLYYYSEVKASKNARKGAMFAFTAAPSLCLFCFLAIAAVAIILSQGTGVQWFKIVAAKSSAYPKEGFWCILFNMIRWACSCATRATGA
jgi:hypothetical protein